MGGTTSDDRVFVVTYTPLVGSKAGREAVEHYGLLPFIDGSIRREPDLEHARPSISCLCRAGKFVPRLQVGDRVLYMTHRRRYGGPTTHWRVTAALRVIQLFESHTAAAVWYAKQRMATPSNCMVPGNKAKPMEHSHQMVRHPGCGPKSGLRDRWDAQYAKRAAKWPKMVATEVLFRDLSWNAPVVERREELEKALGRVPGTQNPGQVTLAGLRKLMKQLGVDADVR
jgi:hypothetical protein